MDCNVPMLLPLSGGGPLRWGGDLRNGIGDPMTSTQKSRSFRMRLSRSVGLSAFMLAVSGGVVFAQAVIVQGNRRVVAETFRSYASGQCVTQ